MNSSARSMRTVPGLGLQTVLAPLAIGLASFAGSAIIVLTPAPGYTQTETIQLAQTEWISFSSEEGGFTVNMPVEPTQQSYRDLTQYIAETAGGNVAYGVLFSDLPQLPESLTEEQVKELLDGAVAGAARSGDVKSQTDIRLGDHFGRELEMIERTGLLLRARIYLVDQRLYQLIIAAQNQKLLDQDSEQFFSSFELQ